MFDKKTVFVVGAGGSCEVGLPLGDELKAKIAKCVDIKFENGQRQISGDTNITEALRILCRDIGVQSINGHLHAGWAISSGMPQAISIDNFLHTHADDSNIKLVGKLGIVASILAAERKSKFYCDSRDGLNLANIPSSWHRTLTKMLLEGVQTNDFNDIFDNISIITFNYDRCIEHYLSLALSNQLLIPIGQAQSVVNKLEVAHPYGQIGRLSWQNGNTPAVAFGAHAQPRLLLDIASQIRVFTERVEDRQAMDNIHRLISAAEVVVYLGFSYGNLNLELLSLPERARQPKVIFGTTAGISTPNVKHIERQIKESMGPDPDVVTEIHLAPLYCDQFLIDHWRPIMG